MSDKQTHPHHLTLGFLLSWGLGILCLILMAQSLLDRPHHFSTIALPYLIAVTILLPPIRKLAFRFSNITLSNPARVVIVMALVSIAALKTFNTAPLNYTNKAPETPASTSNNNFLGSQETHPVTQFSEERSVMLEDVKNDVIIRCKANLDEYGPSLIKACIDRDLRAYNSLKVYPDEHKDIIKRCERNLLEYGWSLVKSCADRDIEAQEAINSYQKE